MRTSLWEAGSKHSQRFTGTSFVGDSPVSRKFPAGKSSQKAAPTPPMGQNRAKGLVQKHPSLRCSIIGSGGTSPGPQAYWGRGNICRFQKRKREGGDGLEGHHTRRCHQEGSLNPNQTQHIPDQKKPRDWLGIRLGLCLEKHLLRLCQSVCCIPENST